GCRQEENSRSPLPAPGPPPSRLSNPRAVPVLDDVPLGKAAVLGLIATLVALLIPVFATVPGHRLLKVDTGVDHRVLVTGGGKTHLQAIEPVALWSDGHRGCFKPEVIENISDHKRSRSR